MVKIAAGTLILIAGFLALLVIMSTLYRIGFLGSIFGFVVVIPLLTIFVYGPAKKMINDGRKEMRSGG
jgi:preprotein translocase subunit SecD